MRMKSRRARQEARERRGERNRAAAGEAHGGADHDLLGDEVLVEPIGSDLLELVAEGRVLDVGVERDDARVDRADGCERRAPRFARGDDDRPSCRRARALRVIRRRFGRLFERGPGSTGVGRVGRPAASRARRPPCRLPSPFLSALPCQPSLPSIAASPLPFSVRARIIVGRPLVARASARPSGAPGCRGRRRRWRASRKRSSARRSRPCRGRTACAGSAERVDVDDRAEVVELVSRRATFGRFPHRSFGHLAVAEQHVGAVVGADAAGVQRGADRRADALPERPGRHVDERQPRRRVSFQIRIERRSFSSSSRGNSPASAQAA